MSDFFVGFRPSPKPNAKFVRFSARHDFIAPAGLGKLVKLLITREQVDVWLAPTIKFDPRQGGKLRFGQVEGQVFGGTYSRISVPHRVVMQTEEHGELDFRLSESKTNASMFLQATKMGLPEDKVVWEASLEEMARGLRGLMA